MQFFLTNEEPNPLSVALSGNKIRYGQPLEIGVPGAGFGRRQAARAWEIAVRLREPSRALPVACDTAEAFPKSRLELEALEAGIQTTAPRLAPLARLKR